MIESASPAVERRRRAAQRISLCAQTLTAERGFDGFTMDDLAEAADVSRRTLFNYFDSKLEAVLGPEQTIHDLDTSEFRVGGPTGNLLSDLGTLAHAHFARMPQDRDEIATMREVIRNPRILAACHDRFEQMAAEVLEMIREREGQHYEETRARMALGLLLLTCRIALDTFLDHDDAESFTVHYDRAIAAAQSLIA